MQGADKAKSYISACFNSRLGTHIKLRIGYMQQQHPSNGPLSGTIQMSRYQKGKTILDLLEQQIVRGSGISWAICKSAPRPRQITTPAPYHSVFTGFYPTNSIKALKANSLQAAVLLNT